MMKFVVLTLLVAGGKDRFQQSSQRVPCVGRDSGLVCVSHSVRVWQARLLALCVPGSQRRGRQTSQLALAGKNVQVSTSGQK